jgi:hypothetical protein
MISRARNPKSFRRATLPYFAYLVCVAASLIEPTSFAGIRLPNGPGCG